MIIKLQYRLLDEVEGLNIQNRLRGRSKRNTNVPNDLVGIYAPFEEVGFVDYFLYSFVKTIT